MNTNIIIRNIRILLIIILGNVLYGQSVENLQRLRKAYEENKKAQEANSILNQESEDEGIIIGEPKTKLIVKPPEIKEYYEQKLESIKDELIALEELLSYTDSIPTLKYFGYNFFTLRDSISQLDNFSVSPDYILGAGDEIIISLWGQAEFQERRIIERDGTIFIENVGLLQLGGKTIEEATPYVLDRLSKVYATLIEKPAKSFFSISLGKVKKISVTVSGHVLRPGNYIIHPSTNLINLLVMAGGVDTTGTMRQLRLIRDNKIIKEIDLYPILTGHGEIKNFNLMTGDNILVPSRRGTVAITGAVIRPAYYEPIKNESAKIMIDYSGGLNHRAGSHFSIINPLKQSSIKPIHTLADMKIQNGDSLFFPEKSSIPVQVSISGAISSPGEYPWFQGITLLDLLSISGAFDTQSQNFGELKNLELVRWNEESSNFKPYSVNVNEFSDDKKIAGNVLLKPFDHITIPRKKGYFLSDKVFIDGHISFPGVYPLLNKKETLSSLLGRAGGVLPGAFEEGIIVKRDSLIVGWSSEDLVLSSSDSIYVPRETGMVMVMGLVHNPGYYTWERGKPITYYLELAGGLKAFSDKNSVVITFPNGTSAPTSGWIKPPVLEGSIISANEGKERPSALNLALDVFRRTTEPFVPIVSILVLMQATGN